MDGKRCKKNMPQEELCKKALDLTGRGKNASTAMLQRELGIGCIDALRTLIVLERKGFCSQTGAKAREALLKSIESCANGGIRLHEGR